MQMRQYGAGSERVSDEEEEDDEIDDLPEAVVNAKQKPQRTSVSSEAFGLFNKKADFKPPHYPKEEHVKE